MSNPDRTADLPGGRVVNASERRKNVSRIYTVEGITANLAQHCRRYGVANQVAHARIVERGWTIEQVLGLADPPPRRDKGLPDPLVRTLPLAPIEEIVRRVILGELTAEEYLRMEGVPQNKRLPEDREAFEVSDE